MKGVANMNTGTGYVASIEKVAATTPANRVMEVQVENLPPIKQVILRERGEVKIGRNDPCACGSGKKFKRCCLGRDMAAPK